MPKVAVVIPARFASTRLPAKPLHLIAGKPLIQHVWERCVRAKGIDSVIVATDDMRIAECAFAFGAEVAMTSPKHRSGTDRVAEVAKKLRGFSHIINVQGDEPLVDPAIVAKLATTMAKDRAIEMITSASIFAPEDDIANPNMVKVVLDRAGDAIYFSRSVIPFVRDGERPTSNAQRSTFNYLRHQGIYGYSMKFLLQFVKWKPGILELAESLEQLRALENGAKIRVVLAKHAAVSVDTAEDVRVVEKLLAA
ncbi:MAG: 3-deoxy-manno-octulosonate cytidylyltransferase [Chthoniobacteraceae bacterium]